MKNIIIKIHSFVDVITNSSTEIFVQSGAGTVKAAKELIEKLLKAADVNKPVDELFDICIEDDELMINPKNGDQETINLTEDIEDIFEIGAEYNG